MRSGITLEDALVQARELDARRRAAGFDQAALDAAAQLGFANGAFEDSPDERAAVAEEFYPQATADHAETSADDNPSETQVTSSTLRDKLERKAMMLGGAAA